MNVWNHGRLASAVAGIVVAGIVVAGIVVAGIVVVGFAGLAGCASDPAPDDKAAQSPAQLDDAIERVSELGPVKATVKLGPREPRLGDPITLVLEVAADPGVTVEMPAFGEALGRFRIVQFVPRESTRDGKRIASQTYTLHAPMSGRQRIPPLRIEIVDQRRNQTDSQAKELLTEEISIEIASVFPQGQVSDELSEPLGPLAALDDSSILQSAWLWLVVALLLAAGGALGIYTWRQAARSRARVSAYDAAMTRLARLESRGMPAAEEIDAWYVELSAIIRRYLEGRYSLRAPELTTEEFLLIARGSGRITSSHRELLSDFLSGCDRVKFAGYEPEEAESRQALQAARRFLQETRLRATPNRQGARPDDAGGAGQDDDQDRAAKEQAS